MLKYILKDLFFKVIVPVFLIWFLFSMFKPVFTKDGVTDYKLVLLICGIPFGLKYIFMWIIPRGLGLGIGGSLAVYALNFILGGIIGVFVMAWRLICAVWYLGKCIFEIILLVSGKAVVTE